MVSSLDGFIAKKDGSVSWLQSTDRYEQGITLSEEEITAFLKTIDCYVMGSRTYEQALHLGWPYGDVPVIVLTSRELPLDRKTIEFYSGDLKHLVEKQLKPRYSNIWLVGGAKTAKDFLLANLVDEIIISMMPVILGDGLLFFDYIGEEQQLHLKDLKGYKDGMVELCYEVRKKEGKAE